MGLLEKLSNPVDFKAVYNEGLKEKQAIESQQLNQQSVQLSVAERQRKADQDRAQAEALMAQYGGANAGTFDPADAMETMKRVAVQYGDADRAIDLAKATRDLKQQSAIHQPIPASQLEMYEAELGRKLPIGTTPADLDRLGGIRRVNISADKATTYAEQLQFQKDKYKQIMASYAPGGFEPDVDPVTKQGPNKRDGELFTKSAEAHARLHSDLDMLEATLSMSGGNDPGSPIFLRQKAILSDILIALKEKNNFGAALTGLEAKYNAAGLPQILARPDVGLTEAVLAAGLGRDPSDIINTMRSLLSTDFDQQRVLYKFKRKDGTVGLPAALSGDSFRLPMSNPAGVAAVPPNAQPRPAGAPAPQPTPSGPPAPQVSRWTPEQEARIQEMTNQKIAELRGQGL
jgi:hypothetical protein